MSNSVKFYKYRKNLFETFRVRAIQFNLDYETILRSVEFINNISFDELKNNQLGYVYVGKAVQNGFLEFGTAAQGTVEPIIKKFNARPSDYIVRTNDNELFVMPKDNFEYTFELSENSKIFHSEWVNIPELGGQTYREYTITKNIFIITNDNDERFFVYSESSNNRFIISKTNIHILIATLYGFVNIKDLFKKDALVLKSENGNFIISKLYDKYDDMDDIFVVKEFLDDIENYNYVVNLEENLLNNRRQIQNE